MNFSIIVAVAATFAAALATLVRPKLQRVAVPAKAS